MVVNDGLAVIVNQASKSVDILIFLTLRDFIYDS